MTVLVYQVGKVGSSSVTASLRRVRGLEVIQVHRLNPANIARVREEHRNRGWEIPPGDRDGEEVIDRLIRPGLPIRVVTLVRDPIARNISYYFQNLDKICNLKDAHASIPVEELVRRFPVEFPYSDDPLHWFDYEFRPVLGIDVYEHPFDAESGIQVIDGNRCRVLILRADVPDEEKSSALERFLGVRMQPLVSANVTADKPGGEAHRKFLSLFRAVPEYTDRMLGSKLARHFFAPAALSALRDRYLHSGTIVPDDFLERHWDD